MVVLLLFKSLEAAACLCVLSGNTPTTEPAQLLANAQAINDERMEALGREKQTIPAGLDRFTYWFPEKALEDDPRLPSWIRTLAQGKKLERPPSKFAPPPAAAL